MKHLLELLKWDHLRFTALLNYLVGVVEGLERDEEPDYAEFIELITYLKPALKGSHQAEELALWRRLSQYAGPQHGTVTRMETLHRAVIDKGMALESGVRAAQAGARLPPERLQRLADDFVSAFREQMAIEEQTIFPLLESVMPEHEWCGDAASAANGDQPRGE
jgi:hemerythrin-like domain-containing protein